MLGFKILVSGLFNEQQITIGYKDHEKEHTEEERELIEKAWASRKSSGIRLYDGKLFDVVSYDVRERFMRLELQSTTYKILVGTSSKEFISRFGYGRKSNTLSVGAVVVTSDERLIAGKRRKDLYFNPGTYSIIAGTMDRERDLVDGMPSPFEAVLRELSEERGVDKGHAKEIFCLGLIYNIDYGQTYMPFTIKLDIPSKSIDSMLPTEEEFEKFIKIVANKKSVSDFLISKRDELSQTCMGNILLFGRYTFGEDWFQSTSRRLDPVT